MTAGGFLSKLCVHCAESIVPRSAANRVGGANVSAFLDLLAFAEIGDRLLSLSDDGYNVIVGGKTFSDYSRHPNILVDLPRLGIKSSAAGRYQFLARTWNDLQQQMGLKDFGPESQDCAAVRMIGWVDALGALKLGRLPEVVGKCRKLWASLPGAGYGQPEKKMAELVAVYQRMKGTLA